LSESSTNGRGDERDRDCARQRPTARDGKNVADDVPGSPASTDSVISRKPAWWVVGCGFILSLPVLLAGFPALTHDGRVHEVWYTNFAAQFWAGALYPRWLK